MDMRRQKLKVSEEKGSLTIQNDQFAVQALFSSPILEVCNYLEQTEKYAYRSALSGINLKPQEFDQYYSQNRDRIDSYYNMFLVRSLEIMEDLIVTAKFAKTQMWHQEAMVVAGIKTNLYLKNLDPYNFNPSQFDPTKKKAIETLQQPLASTEESRSMLAQLADKLKEVESMKMEDMFTGKVSNPYIAQNKEGTEVDPSSLFSSYVSLVKIKMERSDQALIRKHFTIHEDVLKFGQSVFEHSLKLQKTAAYYIRKYSEMPPNDFLVTQIAQPIQFEGRRHQVDADQLTPGRQVRSDSKPSLINRNGKVEFKSCNRVLNLETMTEELVEHHQNEEREQPESNCSDLAPRESPFDLFTERRRIFFRDTYQQRQIDRRIREDEIRYGYRDTRDRQKEKVIVRRIIRTTGAPAPWSEFANHKCPLFFFQESREEKEKVIWDLLKGNCEEENLFTYFNKPVIVIPPKQEDRNRSKTKEKDKEKEAKREQEEAEKAANERQWEADQFEKRRTMEENTRLGRLQNLIEEKSYLRFLALSKIEKQTVSVEQKQAKRYGMLLWIPLQINQPFDSDKFFYFYFKERYYREHEEVRQNSENPIIFLDQKKINMGSSHKIVSQLLSSVIKRTQTTPFFLLWSEDLMAFQLSKHQGKTKGLFKCFCYSSGHNCRKLMYELRRRAPIQIKQVTDGSYKVIEEDERVYSKVEVAHRLLYNRHLPPPTPEESILKGRQITAQILDRLRQEVHR